MDLLQALAGRATDAMGRLTASLHVKPAETGAAPGAAAFDFASALAHAMTPGATLPEGEAETAGDSVATDLSASDAASLDAALATAATTPVDPTLVHRGLDRIDPEFKARLARVVERMETEFGHKVKVVETFRTQERQNFLYEQGRSRPGPVVTWTRASNHTLGRAADVIIDGSYGNPIAYQRLGEIAAEEGLRTLGPRDAGHIELVGGGSGSAAPRFASTPGLVEPSAAAGKPVWEPGLEVAATRAAAPASPSSPRSAAGIARVAEVAQVARVAEVAQVAEVARVATVATPGSVAFSAAALGPGVQAQAFRVDRGAAASGRMAEAVQALHQAMGSHQGIAALRTELGRTFGDTGSGAGEGDSAPAWQPEAITPDGALPRTPFQSAVTEILAATGTGSTERLARVLELQEGAAAAPVNSVLLRVDNPAGGEDRIRVDLRGAAVEATIDMKNAGEAERVAHRLGDLQRTLERHGLESETLRVRATSQNSTDAAELARVGINIAESGETRGFRSGSGGGGSGSDSFRDAWKESSQGQGQSRRDPSDPRNRERRYQPPKENA